MKKPISVFAATLLTLGVLEIAACSPEASAVAPTAPEAAKAPVPEQKLQKIDVPHTSQNSLNWDGVYSGTIPAASGPGIEIKITLNKDSTYTLRRHYIGRDGDFTDAGRFKWDKDGRVITLDAKDMPPYQVGENTLIQLDMEGKPIAGALADNYVLRKQP